MTGAIRGFLAPYAGLWRPTRVVLHNARAALQAPGIGFLPGAVVDPDAGGVGDGVGDGAEHRQRAGPADCLRKQYAVNRLRRRVARLTPTQADPAVERRSRTRLSESASGGLAQPCHACC